MRLRKLNIILLLIIIFVTATWLINALNKSRNFTDKIIKTPEPEYYRSLFKEDSKLFHYKSELREESSIMSVYNYNNFESLILVFREKVNSNNINEIVNLNNGKIHSQPNKIYKGSIFRDDLRYTFNNHKEVIKATIFLDENKSEVIKKKTDSLIFLSYKSGIGLKLNDEEKFTFYSEKRDKRNQVIILIKGNFIYFIYSKSMQYLTSGFGLYEALAL